MNHFTEQTTNLGRNHVMWTPTRITDESFPVMDHLDLILMTHPVTDRQRKALFPTGMKSEAKPVMGEIREIGGQQVGILYMPFSEADLKTPKSRRRCRHELETHAFSCLAPFKPRVVCLDGLPDAISHDGRAVWGRSTECGIRLTTGHNLTAISLYNTWCEAMKRLGRRAQDEPMTVVGMGSVGLGFCRLLQVHKKRPVSLVLIDRPTRARQLHLAAAELRRHGMRVRVELTDHDGTPSLNGAIYQGGSIISSVRRQVINIDVLASGSVLVDDGAVPGWSREDAWRRADTYGDILPCEGALIEVTTDSGHRSAVSSRLAEGLLMAMCQRLPESVGAPTRAQLNDYERAYRQHGLRIAELQCGGNVVPEIVWHSMRTIADNPLDKEAV